MTVVLLSELLITSLSRRKQFTIVIITLIFLLTNFLMENIMTEFQNHELKIRSLRLDDMKQIVELLQSVSSFTPIPSSLNAIAEKFLKSENIHACIVEYEQSVIAFGSIFLLGRIRGGYSAVIEDVVVRGDARRKGVGRLLIASLLEHAVARKCFKVSLVTKEENISFYESLGFQKDLQGMRINL